jgi:phosphoglycolate phosphatase
MYHRLATDVDERQIPSMVDKYRERYLEIGFSENVLYDGMREVIDELHELRSCNRYLHLEAKRCSGKGVADV